MVPETSWDAQQFDGGGLWLAPVMLRRIGEGLYLPIIEGHLTKFLKEVKLTHFFRNLGYFDADL